MVSVRHTPSTGPRWTACASAFFIPRPPPACYTRPRRGGQSRPAHPKFGKKNAGEATVNTAAEDRTYWNRDKAHSPCSTWSFSKQSPRGVERPHTVIELAESGHHLGGRGTYAVTVPAPYKRAQSTEVYAFCRSIMIPTPPA